jgi:hypothetical protein
MAGSENPVTLAPPIPRVSASPRLSVAPDDPIEQLNGLDRAAAERIIADADRAFEDWCEQHPSDSRPSFMYRYHAVWRDTVRAGLRSRCLSLRQAVDVLRAVRVLAGW